MIYVYAIIDRPEAGLPDLVGLQDAPLVSLPCQEIAAVISPFTTQGKSAEIEQSGPNVWRHEAVLEALMDSHSVLPVRFGEIFSNENAVTAMLLTHQSEYATNLQRVRGRVELSLRVIWTAEADPVPFQETVVVEAGTKKVMSGYEYMQSRLKEENGVEARRRKAEAMAMALQKALVEITVESSHQVVLTSPLCLKTAYLIAKRDVQAFREQIEHQVLIFPEVRFLLTGPWPAYNFVTV